MRKYNPVRYSSAVGEAWMHASFKVKYCYKIFDIKGVRDECDRLFDEASKHYGIPIEGKGFDSDHVHMKVDIANYSRPQIAKMLKGYTAKCLFNKFPWLKHKYFWNSGLWSRCFYIGSAKNIDSLDKYLKKQKYYDPIQTRLSAF